MKNYTWTIITLVSVLALANFYAFLLRDWLNEAQRVFMLTYGG